MYTCECLRMGLCMWVQYPRRPQEGKRFHGAGSDKLLWALMRVLRTTLGSLKSSICSLSLSQPSSPLWRYLNACHKPLKGMDHVSLTSWCSVLSAGLGIELKLMFEVLVPIPSTMGSMVPPLSSLLGSESCVVICILFTAWCRWSQIVRGKCFWKHSNAVKG